MRFSGTSRTAFIVVLVVVMVGGVSSPSLARFGLVQSDSVTLNAAGDTKEISYSKNITHYEVNVDGGAVHIAQGDSDATDADFPLFDDQPPLIRSNRWVSKLNIVSDGGNGSAITVWIEAYR